MAVWVESADSNIAGHLFVIMTVLLVSPCLCAPKHPPWWTDACNKTPSYNICKSIPNMRHGRSPIQDPVRDQLKILISAVKTNQRHLQIFYMNITHRRIPANAKIKQLNLNKMLKQMRNGKKNKWVPFHVGLQKIARYLDQLRRTRNKSEGTKNTYNRNCYMSEIIYSLRSLLCEVSYFFDEQKPPVRPHLIKGGLGRPNSMDTTNLFMHDMTVLRKMLRFLKASQKILGKKKHNAVRTLRRQ